MITLPWDIKYSPKSLDGYIFKDEKFKNHFYNLKRINSLLFSGTAGTGKTTLAKLLVNHYNIDPMDVLFMNASDENGVDIIRDKVKSFISTSAYSDYKVVICDEADYLSLSAMSVLRSLMLEYVDNASFIFTCNYDNKIMPAIKSRCEEFKFTAFSKDDILEMIATILIDENIKTKLSTLEYYVDLSYPDIRKTIKTVQQNCVNGRLVLTESSEFNILKYIQNDDWRGLRNELTTIKDFDYNNIFETLYKNIDKCEKFNDVEKYEDGILTIAEYLKNAKENPMIQTIACIIALGKL